MPVGVISMSQAILNAPAASTENLEARIPVGTADGLKNYSFTQLGEAVSGGVINAAVAAGEAAGLAAGEAAAAPALTAAAAAQTSADAAQGTANDALELAQAAGDTTAVATLADLAALTDTTGLTFVQTMGRTQIGVGAALYKAVGSAPSHVGRVQSADGQWWEIAEPVIHAEHLGAIGDGTDQTAAIQAAADVAAAQGKGAVRIGAGVFLVSTVSFTGAGCGLIGAGRGRTVLRRSSGGGSAAPGMLDASGAEEAARTLSSTAALSATNLSFTTAGLAAGGYGYVADAYSYSPTDAGYRSGEMCQISAVSSGSSVTVYRPLDGSNYSGRSYTTGNGAKFVPITPVIAPVFRDFSAEGHNDSLTPLVRVAFSVGAVVKDCSFSRNGSTAVRVHVGIDATVSECVISDLRDDVANGFAGYGVAVSGASECVQVINNLFSRCRHGVTTLGGAAGFPHRLWVVGNTTRDTYEAGIDTHNSGEFVELNENRIFQSGGAGISCRSRHTVIRGNYIVEAAAHGIYGAETGMSDITICNNFIRGCSGRGILVNEACDNLLIHDNYIVNSGADGIELFASADGPSGWGMIRNNFIRNVGLVTASSCGIQAGGSQSNPYWVVEGNTVIQDSGAGSAATAIDTTSLFECVVTNNTVKGTFSSARFTAIAAFERNNRAIDADLEILRMDPDEAVLRASGADANIDIFILPKGTGKTRFGTYTAGSGSVAGYITISDAAGTNRKLAVIP